MVAIVKKKQYWPLLAAAYVVVATVMALKGSLGATVTDVGAFLGGGIGLALFPFLAMRFLSNRAGWILLALLGVGYSQGELNWLGESRSTATPVTPFRHIAKGCEFSVEFPDKPTIKTYTSPQIGDYEEALWTSQVPEDSTALRTECIPIPALSEKLTSTNGKQFLLDLLSKFAHDNGLSAVEYRYALKKIGPTGMARGIKTIQGVPVTFQIVVVGGNSSLITLYAGGRSATFPQREISPFLSSVQRTQ